MKEKKSILPNGLTVVTVEKPESYTTVLGFSVKAGSFDELSFPLGTAHFVEHMLFKGTKTRTNRDINQAINRIGGDLNAFTYYEETKYYAITPKDGWKIALDLLLDILWNSTLSEEEIEKERNVILEEIKMYNDDPIADLLDRLQSHMLTHYKERQTILGTEESVLSITRNDLLRFVNTYYHPSNMILVATGAINHNELLEVLSSYPMKRDTCTPTPRRTFIPSPLVGEYTFYENMEQSYLAFGLFGPPANHKDCVPFEVLHTILGGNESSRLFEKIREEKGLAYLLSTHTDYFSDYGTMYGYLGTSKEVLNDVLSIITTEMKNIYQHGVSEEELETAISYLKGRNMIEMESNIALNDYISSSIIYNEPINPKYYFEELSSVTCDDVQRVAQKYFNPNNFITICMIGDVEEI